MLFCDAWIQSSVKWRCAGWMVGNQLDGWPLVIGVQTLFKQVHCELNEQFIKYMTQYIHSYIKAFTR